MKCKPRKQNVISPTPQFSNQLDSEAVEVSIILQVQNIPDIENQEQLVIQQQDQTYLLPFSYKKTLILDLDETLIHSQFEFTNNCSKVIKLPIDDQTADLQVDFNLNYIPVYLSIRNGAEDFIKNISQHFDLVLWTASPESYAEIIMNEIDPRRIIQHRLYRNHCSTTDRGLVYKDLSQTGRKLDNVIIVDNSRLCFVKHPNNGILIQEFIGKQDNCLQTLEIELIKLCKYQRIIDHIPGTWGEV